MKALSILLISCLMTVSIFAQNRISSGSIVTININGNNREVMVDGKSYPIDNIVASNGTTPVTITDLQPGQHTLEVVRVNPNNNNRRTTVKTTFNVRSRYDLAITVNGNGTLQLQESRINGTYAGGTTTNGVRPMSRSNFRLILQNAQRQWKPGARMAYIEKVFANTNNHFTSNQAMQLISTITGETSRLQLAKSSFRS